MHHKGGPIKDDDLVGLDRGGSAFGVVQVPAGGCRTAAGQNKNVIIRDRIDLQVVEADLKTQDIDICDTFVVYEVTAWL